MTKGRTLELIETKHGLNIPHKALTKSSYFVGDPSSNMAASIKLPVGNLI